jgi:DNA mismatch repair ATPase MutS
LSASTRAVIAHWSGVKCADATVGVRKVAQAGGRARLESLPAAYVDVDAAQATVAKMFSKSNEPNKRKKRSNDDDDDDDDDDEQTEVIPTTQTPLSQLAVLPGLSLACVSAVHQHLQSLGGRLERCLTMVENYRDFNESTAMRLDAGAIRNLSLFADASAIGETRGTLFAHINRTRTSAG